MTDNDSHDLDLLNLIKYLNTNKFFIIFITLFIFITFSSIYVFATINKNDTYNISITAEKKKNNNLNIQSFITIDNIAEAIAIANINSDLETKDIFNRIIVTPGDIKINNLESKLMDENSNKMLKQILTSPSDLTNIMREIYSVSNNYYEFSYIVDNKSKLNNLDIKRLLISLITVINKKIENYIAENENESKSQLIKLVDTYKNIIVDESNENFLSAKMISELYSQSVFIKIQENLDSIKFLNVNYSSYVRNINLDSLASKIQMVRYKYLSIVHSYPFLLENLTREKTMEIDYLVANVKALDEIISSLDGQIMNAKYEKSQELEDSKNIFATENAISEFLNIGARLHLSSFRKELLNDKKNILFKLTDAKHQLGLILRNVTIDLNIKNSTEISQKELDKIKSSLIQVGNATIAISNEVNQYIKLVHKHINKNNSISSIGLFKITKSPMLALENMISIFLISIVSLCLSLMLSLGYNRKN